MKLPEYKSFKQKEKNFTIHYIDTIDEFRDLLKNHSDSLGIYRGISQSSYKIYTSLQRQIIEKGLKNFNIENYIKEARNQSMLKKYFTTFKIIPSKLSIWSYLQHYGAPTPLIDFTYDILKAIYFAIEKFDESNFESKGGIVDRFSVFFISNSDIKLLDIEDVYKDQVEYKKRAEDVFNSYPPEKDFDYNSLLEHIDRMLDINVLEIFMLENKEAYVEIFNLYNNIRIIAQEGLFINNSYLDVPFEEGLKKFFTQATRFQASPWDDIDTPEAEKINNNYLDQLEKNKEYQRKFEENIIHSYEIKKELIPEIRKLCFISKKDIYPNEEEIAWKIFLDSIK